MLPIIYLGMLKHLTDWVAFFLEQHSRIVNFGQLWVMMPPYPGFARFNKPYSQLTEWSGKEMKALGHVIEPVFGATLSNPVVRQRIPITEALLCFTNLVYFHFMAQDHISKKHCRLGTMAVSEWLRSVRAVRDTPVAGYSTPGVNTTRCVAYRPPIAVSSRSVSLLF
jgi:hypothetical protein